MNWNQQFLSLALSIACIASAQAQSTTVGSATDRRLESQIIDNREAIRAESQEYLDSDTGLQQVVEVKKTKLGGFIGANASYFYRDNALSVNEPIGRAIKSDIFQTSVYGALSYGNYSIGKGVLTPYLGSSWTQVYHQREKVEFADYSTQKFYLLGQYALPDNWIFTPSIEFSRNINDQTKTEDYKEWHPNFSISKSYGLKHQQSIKFLYNIGRHLSEIDDFGKIGGRTSDQLDNWTHTFSSTYYKQWGPILLSTYGQLIYKTYDKGQNKDREDFMKIVGGDISYTFKLFKVSGFANYTDRTSDQAVDEFENWDAGVSLSVNHSF